MNRRQKRTALRIILAVFVLIAALLFFDGVVRISLIILAYIVAGYDILLNALRGIVNLQPFDENFLMAVATIGAMVLGEYVEGAAVLLFYQIGELFQSIAVGKSRKSIASLMDIRSDTTCLELADGTTTVVQAETVEPGSVIVIKPGERVSIDGVVLSGSSSLDTSALTGESMPRDVRASDEVLSGSINLSGVIRLRTTKRFEDSTVSRILALVESAGIRKSRSEKFISKFARVYTPVVCLGALLLAVLPPLVNILLLHAAAMWSTWVYRALTFLVISCPCALVISVPLTFFSGIGSASREGILLKGSNYIEALAKVDTVVFDKTGTLTEGTFSVSRIVPQSMSEQELLYFAAAAESYSSHPVSECIRKAYSKPLDDALLGECKELAGMGVVTEVSGKSIAAGNEALMRSLGIEPPECDYAGTVVHIAVQGEYAGHIVLCDVVKSSAKSALRAIKNMGVKSTVMLSGDHQRVAESVANELGIDKVYARLLPEDKVTKLEQIMATQSSRGLVAYVGDGINDAPVITRADVGIAMGALGSDAAIEAADVVLMDDEPQKVAKAISVSRKCMAIVWQNIIFAVGIKLLCLVLGAFGIANMWAAIFADVGVMVLAVLNAIRAMFVK